MGTTQIPDRRQRPSFIPNSPLVRETLIAFGLIMLCWGFYFFTRIVLDFVRVRDVLGFLPGRLVVIGVGACLSLCMYAVLRFFWGRSVWLTAALVVLASTVTAIPFAVFNWWMITTFSAANQPLLLHSLVAWSASVHIFFAQSVVLVAFLYARQLRQREADAIQAEKSQRQAELRALRYQVNPHFLFNALNSVSALLTSRRVEEAERMVDMLASYYERALIAPQAELAPVRDEIEAQLRYLDIERIRFPDRLEVEVDLPEGLEQALAPTLMIQPLIENSIKHAVSSHTTTVTVRIAVSQLADSLVIEVSDRCAEAPVASARAGTGTGLNNIRNRLAAVYGDQAALEAGPVAGGFRSVLALPLRFKESQDESLLRG